jgi:hypothetical protein
MHVAWVAHYNGPASSYDSPTSLLVDPLGNVFVTGVSMGIESSLPPACTSPTASGHCWDYATVKYDRDGQFMWAARYNGPGSLKDHAGAAAVDSDGSVYVTGTSCGAWGDPNSRDIATLKYDSHGALQWVSRYGGPEDDSAYWARLDCAGELVVAGTSMSTEGSDVVTLKYDRDGTIVWIARYEGLTDQREQPRGLAIDRNGFIYVPLVSWNKLKQKYELLIINYDSSGNLIWDMEYSEEVNSVDVLDMSTFGPLFDCGGVPQTEIGDRHPEGFLYFVGGSGEYPTADYLTLKFKSDGKLIWATRYDGVVNGYDFGHGIAVDGAGNAIVTGQSMIQKSEEAYDMVTIKYDPHGKLLWEMRRRGTAPPTGRALEGNIGHHVGVDSDNNAYVAGRLVNEESGNDLLVAKYDPEGRELWSHLYHTTGADLEGTADLVVDDQGAFYVAGRSRQRGRGMDYTAVKNIVVTPPLAFLRGDCNGDHGIDLTDAVYVLVFNFRGGPQPPCLAACDANADGEFEAQLSDAVYLLSYCFLGGPAPPDPFPLCNPSGREADALLGCENGGC